MFYCISIYIEDSSDTIFCATGIQIIVILHNIVYVEGFHITDNSADTCFGSFYGSVETVISDVRQIPCLSLSILAAENTSDRISTCNGSCYITILNSCSRCIRCRRSCITASCNTTCIYTCCRNSSVKTGVTDLIRSHRLAFGANQSADCFGTIYICITCTVDYSSVELTCQGAYVIDTRRCICFCIPANLYILLYGTSGNIDNVGAGSISSQETTVADNRTGFNGYIYNIYGIRAS